MMIKKIIFAASCAAMLAMMAAPAHAAAYFIGGKWYYFSIDFEADLAKVTGKDLKDGTRVQVVAKITNSNVQCGNPTGQTISGTGPTGTVYGTSPNVDPSDLTTLSRDSRVKGNVYKSTTAVTKLVDNGLKPPFGCENSAGNGNWAPVYWRYLECNKGDITGKPEVCYQERAIATSFADGTATALMYVTGPDWKKTITGDELKNWTYVYLPTQFKYKATIEVLTDATTNPPTYTTSTEPNGTQYGVCSFPANIESGAKYYGQPYSLNNPPVNGWAATPVDYACEEKTQVEYDAL